jgi:ubiquinone/menaquinone biosynthesis C-methylase UbiE
MAFGYFPSTQPLRYVSAPYASLMDIVLGQDNLLKRLQVDETFHHLDLSPDEDVLEVGASAMYYSGEIARRVRRMVALDYFDGFVEQLQHRRFPSNLEAVQGDAQELPFPDESFDKVFISEVFPVLPDPQKAATEAWRVLRPGGKLVTVHGNRFKEMKNVFAEAETRPYIERAHQRWGSPSDAENFEREYYGVHGTNPEFFRDRDAYVDGLLLEAGFARLEKNWLVGIPAQRYYCRLLLKQMARTGKPVLGRGQVLHLRRMRQLGGHMPTDRLGLTYVCSGWK